MASARYISFVGSLGRVTRSSLQFIILLCICRPIHGELTYQIQESLGYDDHIEFGLSVDPDTSPLAGRQDSQLSGLLNQLQSEAKWVYRPVKVLKSELNLSGQRYHYLEPKQSSPDQKMKAGLTAFNGYAYQLSGRLDYQFSNRLPSLRLGYQLQRQNRVDAAYDQRWQGVELSWGQIVSYRYKRNWFDDEITKRKDFQLVGSQLHQLECGLQLKLWFKKPGQLNYLLTLRDYQPNLSDLIWFATGLSQVDRRFDRLHQLTWRQPWQLNDRLILQTEVFYQRNQGNLSFYHFSIRQTNLLAFYLWQPGRSIQLTTAGRWLTQTGRKVENEEDFRRDFQWQIEAELRWRLNQKFSLVADHRWIQNQTNETVQRLSFLNYVHNQLQLAVVLVN